MEARRADAAAVVGTVEHEERISALAVLMGNDSGGAMRAMIMHFALGAALTNGLDRPVVYRFPSDEPARNNGKTIVEVENTSCDDTVVYAFQGLRVQRLGTVSGMTIRQLVIPPEFLFDEAALRFSVYPIGTRTGSVSDEVSVSSGEKLNLFIPPI